MKKFLKIAAIAAALAMFVSAAAEAQGGGAGGQRGGGQGRGGGRGGMAGRMSAEGVTADSAYALMMTGITVDAAKKTAIMALVTKFQADLKANPAPQMGRGADGAAVQVDTVAMNKRNGVISAFRTEVKKHLTTEQQTTFDTQFPQPGARRGGGGGGILPTI